MSAKTTKRPDTKGDRTTLRTVVTEDEHEAVRWYAKAKMGQTLCEFVRQAIDCHLRALAGKTLAVMAEESKHRGKLVQEELF